MDFFEIRDQIKILISEVEGQIKSPTRISFPPGLKEIKERENDDLLFFLKSAHELLENSAEKEFSFLIENLNFKEQQRVYWDLAEFKASNDPEMAFEILREKSIFYSDLQKLLVRLEFSKLEGT